ncbi:MAG: efflux RND transporter permease subunit [Pseudomonadota bacterium]
MITVRSFLTNHVLANLVFVLVIALGLASYLMMPRAKDPDINLYWINVITVFPGASAEDIERRVTDPMEEAIERSVKDIKFVSSTSREGVSNIIIRFDYLDERTYDKRLADLRREVQNVYTDQMPEAVEDPLVVELNSSNWFPTASIAITGAGDDENLRKQTRNIKKDIEAMKGVDQLNPLGLREPELHILDPTRP